MEKREPLKVQMFGQFTLSSGGARIKDSDNRSKKVWLFLAYLIYNRGKPVDVQSYIELLWNKDEEGANPTNALKTILHRVRSTLDQLWPGAGHALVLSQGTTYRWNTEYPVILDVDEFERLSALAEKAGTEEEELKHGLAALENYEGEFLARFRSSMWTIPIATYYHQAYLQLVLRLLPLLRERGRYHEMENVCRAALVQDPYAEELHYHLIDALSQMGKQREVTVAYEDMAQLLMDDFGVMPSERIRALYREAVSARNDHSLPADVILEQLREPAGSHGAMICQYDIFRSIYRSVARSLIRSGDVVHLALFSIHHRNRAEDLSRRSLERVMDNLEDIICGTLRRGDVAARCSLSQFVVMLPQANFENSQKVCQRIQRAFQRQYPHSPASVQFSVYPLEPN